MMSDFFYSGHVGFLLIIALEWYKNGVWKMSVITCLINFYLAASMLACRIHYTIDMLMGLVVAHYCYIIMGYFSPLIDNFVKKSFTWTLEKYNNKTKN
jgi:hypothetical protein